MSAQRRKGVLHVALLIAILAGSNFACLGPTGIPFIDWVLHPETMDQPVPDVELPQDQMATMAAEAAYTEQAHNLGLTQTAVAATQTALASQPVWHFPVIVEIAMPALVPVDGKTVEGTITLQDAGTDVNLVSIESLQGTFGTGSWDPSGEIEWQGDYGSFTFGGICGRHEIVEARVTLKDRAGNTSVPKSFVFLCE